MINIGIIGVGGIAGCHLGSYATLPEARIVALCDIIPERARREVVAEPINIGGDSAEVHVQATPYTDYRDLLADPTVEMVDICLPTYLHAEVTVAALEAGKHVLCEKPMALTVADCDAMIAAAKASGRMLMIAQCIRFWPEYRFLKDCVDDGRYGSLTSAGFLRLGGKPGWSARNWFRDPALSGGSLMDLHIHDTDFITFLLGLPARVTCWGVEDADGISQVVTRYDYPNGPVVTAEGGWHNPPSFPFRMTFYARFAEASLEWDGRLGPMKVYPLEGEPFVPEVAPGDGYHNEIAYFLDCVASGIPPAIVTPRGARESVRLILLEAESVRSGETVKC